MKCPKWIVSAVALGGAITSVGAHAAEAKKPPLFTYIAQYAFPRSEWRNIKWQPKELASNKALVRDGTLVGFGQEDSLLHSDNGYTHNRWWAAHSASALLNMIADDSLPADPEMNKATKHSDGLIISEHYGYRPGTIKNGILFSAAIVFKDDAPKDAQDVLIKQFYEPVLEKMLADGVIAEYDLSNEYVSTNSEMPLYLNFMANSSSAIEKVQVALEDAWRASPSRQTWSSYFDWKKERDHVSIENAELK
ncbi:MAG: hypothetical protein KGN98_05825 [Alphaproteobacteria bacterium]|jgi:hypothetical protein|nr:hypothetical protein [Alphaproteobacteria bacterium]